MTFHGIPIAYQDRDDWLRLRREGIGGSDIASVLNLPEAFRTPFAVWADKMGALDDDGGTEAMRLGQKLEGLILDEFAEQTGLAVWFRGLMVCHPTDMWARATLDGLAFDPNDPDDLDHAQAVVEAKASGEWTWDEIPLHYQAQGQWQMAVTGLEVCWFAVLHQGRRFATYQLDADPEDQTQLFKVADEFWRRHVLAELPPPTDAGDGPPLAAKWPQHADVEVEVDSRLVAELARVRGEYALVKSEKERLESALKAQLAEAAVGTVEGRKAVSWKTQKARRVNVGRLQVERPEVAAEFTEESTSRVFRMHMKEGTE